MWLKATSVQTGGPTMWSDRCGLFGSNAARVIGLCRTMEHGIGSSPAVPGCQARTGGGVVVHRLSVSNRECGAESSVYAAAPSAPVDRNNPAAALLAPVHGGPPGAGAPRRAARRAATRRAGCRPAWQKMVCKGHPCIYAADGDSMTQFVSSKVVPCGHRHPRKLSDVHGREG
jgi:hypothetical protein